MPMKESSVSLANVFYGTAGWCRVIAGLSGSAQIEVEQVKNPSQQMEQGFRYFCRYVLSAPDLLDLRKAAGIGYLPFVAV